MDPHAFIFIGRSGSGKGTQAGLLKTFLETGNTPVFYVETGDRFRAFITKDDYASRLSRQIYEAGGRQPDFLGAFMWSKMFVDELKEPSHFILDGVARSFNEAKILETALSFFDMKQVHVIYLDVSRPWSERHLLARGRSDDKTVESIRKRLDWFDADVLPAVEYFESSSHHFIRVNGEQSIEAVHADIRSALGPLLS